MPGRGALAAVAVVAVLAAGCGGGTSEAGPLTELPTLATSATSPTTEPAPTTSAAPSTPEAPAGAPTLPPAATEHTPEGAAAFVQHWFDTLQYSWTVMDSAPIRTLGECLTCIAFANTVDDIALHGNHLQGGAIVIHEVAPSQILSDGSATPLARFSATQQEEVGPDGSVVDVVDTEAVDVQYLFTLDWSTSVWKVSSIQGVE